MMTQEPNPELCFFSPLAIVSQWDLLKSIFIFTCINYNVYPKSCVQKPFFQISDFVLKNQEGTIWH